ncbi:hypothetical protein [Streptomyces sp. NRRL F-5527]|uniref:hypothetical protein n=1 Tax=Streptomyces sp. NRRL F-5527 TaxID=1463862 RepID=UPI0004C98238|nr:hypothetical protein [Streptomyces sp. NRRL F-5527]
MDQQLPRHGYLERYGSHDGTTDTSHSSVRLYAPAELTELLHPASFVVDEQFDGYDAPTADSSRHLVTAHRP